MSTEQHLLEQPRKTKAWAVLKSGAKIEETVVELPPLQQNQVEVKIAACGVCASDVGAVQGKFDASGMYTYPLVAGHEGVGRVVGVGALVKHLKVGDRVGLGIYRDSCGGCSDCFHGNDNSCGKKKLMFMLGNTGCFSEYVRIDARYAIAVPEAIPTQFAGPLFCAGATTFSPFRIHNVQPGQHVGVVGIGGLGHLAIKFARSYGCRVTAFSRGTAKENECKQLGAHHYVDTTNPDSLKSLPCKVDYLMLTASGADINVPFLLSALRPHGKLVIMGLSGYAPTPVSFIGLVMNQNSIVGGAGASLGQYTDMVNFSALHNILPQCELFPVAQINDVIEKVDKGNVKYRAVLVIDESLF